MSSSRQELVEQVIQTVASWRGVEAAAHRFGGVEWRLGRAEIGHIHRQGMLDIPYTIAIRDALIAEGRTGPHHILPETGWTTFYLRDEGDLERALWLVKLSYIHKGLRRLRGADFGPMFESLKLSAGLRRLIENGGVKHHES